MALKQSPYNNMSIPVVRFNTQDQPEFYKELRKRVNDYFKEKGVSRHADSRMVIKTVFMVLLYILPLIVLISGVVTSFWIMMAMWVIMGLGMSGIGLAVMHDANHGAYSKNPKVNTAVGAILTLVGGYPPNWKIQHNVLHHSFTNVQGYDEDIENGLMRFSPDQPKKAIFKYQAYYATFLYGLMTIYWLVGKDIVQLLRYDKMGLLETQGLSKRRAWSEMIFHKVWYVAITIVLPMIFLPFAWYQILLGFLVMHFICGVFLAFIFQPAHVIEETSFFTPSEEGSVENSWAIHQLATTANFANDSKILSWFVGGLNFQIEHHLFPNICHIHYKELSPIVKKLAGEYGIPYHQHKTFLAALKSHFSLLNDFGTGAYDAKMAAA